jgi:DNA helicase-2/ATP-dependent DNA helicase PcrA
MSDLSMLNEQQREAALHKDGPLLILAGAGSGKTATMTRRIARLIEEDGVRPYNILAVTFTNKAAAEMRERVERLIGRADIWIMTFHAVCLRILRADAERLGYSKSFAVYDPSDQKAAVKRCMKEAGIETKKYTPAAVLSAISGYKEDGKSPADVKTESERSYSPTRRDMAEIYARYSAMLRANNAMDFDDLILNAVRLFERDEEVLHHYQERFHYIMVDEYQDTNRLQYRFVRYLAEKRGNLCVVGDDDQCIYQWRGADITNILNFERDFKGAKVIRLEQNYRSKGNILTGANSVIKENKGRKSKALWTDRGDGDKISYKLVAGEREEAAFVADEILRLNAEGANYRDVAVLCRTNAQSRTFEEAFIAKGIDYQMLGQVRYYDRKEIKDMLSYMSLVQNPGDDIAFLRIINEPKRGIGGTSVEKLAARAQQLGVSLMELFADEHEIETVLSAKAKTAATEIVSVLVSFASVYEEMKISDLYDELLTKTGYLKALEDKNTVEDDVRIENLLEFRSAILESEQEDPTITLADFMEKIALMADVDNHDHDANAVVVMTLHSAKGLEFPVVFMPGMEEGLFPSERAVTERDGVEEERRLCYVGMTRAMEKLYLVRARERTLYGRRNYTLESRFLSEIDKSVLDETGDMPGEEVSGYLHKDYGGYGGSGIGGVGSGRGYGGYSGGRRGRGPQPFDMLRAARDEVDAKAGRVLMDLKSGDRIKHAKFGEGLVLEAAGSYVTVMFDEAGKKKLALDVAPLEKIG